MKYIIKVGFWDVKKDRERSEIFRITAASKDKACNNALSQAKIKFKKLVTGVEPFFVEQIQESINGKTVVLDFKSTIEFSIPTKLNDKILKAISLHKFGRDLTMEDKAVDEKCCNNLQMLQQTQKLKVFIKVTEDGQFLVFPQRNNR